MLLYVKRIEKMLQDLTHEAVDNSNINSGQVAKLQTHHQKVPAQNKKFVAENRRLVSQV